MKGGQQLFRPVEDDLEGLCAELAGHVVVPGADHYQYVLHSHLLQQVQQLLPTTLLPAVVEPLDQRLLTCLIILCLA